MTKGDALRGVGIFIYIILTITDRFCFNIDDYIYIPLALISLVFIIIGFIINKISK